LHGSAAARLIDRVHRFGIQRLRLIQNLRVLADGVMNFLNALMQDVPQAEILVQLRFRQKIEPENALVVRPDTVNAPETLNQPDRVPMQIVVDDVVAILKIQAFGKHIGGDHRAQLRFIVDETVFRVRLGREPADHAFPALVPAEDNLDIGILAIGVQVGKQIFRRVGILSENKDFRPLQLLAGQPRDQSLKFGVFIRRDRRDQFQNLLEQLDIMPDIAPQRLQIKISHIVTLRHVAESLNEITLGEDIAFVKNGLRVLARRHNAIVQ